MGKMLQALNVPADSILYETESENTRQNAVYTADLLAREELETVILVTTARHMPRAVASFNKVGVSVIPSPTDYFVTGDPDLQNGNISRNFKLLNVIPQSQNLDVTTKSMKE